MTNLSSSVLPNNASHEQQQLSSTVVHVATSQATQSIMAPSLLRHCDGDFADFMFVILPATSNNDDNDRDDMEQDNDDDQTFSLHRKLLRRRHVRKEQLQRRKQTEQSNMQSSATSTTHQQAQSSVVQQPQQVSVAASESNAPIANPRNPAMKRRPSAEFLCSFPSHESLHAMMSPIRPSKRIKTSYTSRVVASTVDCMN